MLAGPGGLLGAAEGLSYLSLAAGAVVLVLQVRHMPGSLPSLLARCFQQYVCHCHFTSCPCHQCWNCPALPVIIL